MMILRVEMRLAVYEPTDIPILIFSLHAEWRRGVLVSTTGAWSMCR